MPAVVQLEQQILAGAFTFAGIRDEILRGMARAAYFEWWVDMHLRKREEHGIRVPWERPGFDSSRPKRIPASAKAWAAEAAAEWERKAAMPIDVLYWLAANAPGYHVRDPSPEDFGEHIARESFGHGTAWVDEHPPFEPYASVSVYHEYNP